jgi:hypothetical protein
MAGKIQINSQKNQVLEGKKSVEDVVILGPTAQPIQVLIEMYNPKRRSSPRGLSKNLVHLAHLVCIDMTMHTNGMRFCDMENGHSNITNLEWRFIFSLEVFFFVFWHGKKIFSLFMKKKRGKKPPSTHASHTHEKSGLVGTMTQSGSYHMHCAI